MISIGRKSSCLLIGISLLAGTLRLAAQTAWSVQPSPTAQDLWGICSGTAGSFIAVGTGGTILVGGSSSPFYQATSGTTNWLLAVAFGDGEYVAVGDQGTIVSSENYGLNWNQVTAGSARLNGVAFGVPNFGTLWLAVGEGGAIARSQNGIQWTAGNAGVPGWLRGITYRSDLGEFVITGQGGLILTTTDGLTFKQASPGTEADIECSVSGGSPTETLVAGSLGYVAASTDAAAWSTLVPAGATHYRGVAIIGSTAICVGSGGIVADFILGQSGAQAVATATTSDLNAVAVGTDENGTPVAIAVGLGGTIISTPLAVPVSSVLTSSAWAPTLGATVTLTADATGQAPLAYQWAFNGHAIQGATGVTLTVSNIQPAQNGAYSVTVTNALGTSTSQTVVTAAYQPAIPGLVDESFTPALNIPFYDAGEPNFFVLSMPTQAALQADGKLIITGSALVPYFSPSTQPLESLVRFNLDGSPDAAFNSNVKEFAGEDVTGIYAQPDGKTLVTIFVPGGLIGRSNSVTSLRLNPDGTTDSSYTPESVPSGVVMTEDAIPQIMLGDGRYLASKNGLIVRLTPNGTVDPTFVASSPAGNSFVMDPDGRVVVGGATSVFRLNPDGTQDPTFASADVGRAVAEVYLQPSGQIVYITINDSPGLGAPSETLRRLNSDGTLDSTYAGLTTNIGSTVAASAMTPDGSLYLDVVAESPAQSTTVPITTIEGHDHNGIIRIDPSGNFDPTYALNVQAINVPPNGSKPQTYVQPAAIAGILPASNGQWYVWGSFASFNGDAHPGLVRINPQVGTQFSKLGNVSSRSAAGSGSQTLIVGFVTQGPTDMTMLLRGVGPGLALFGVNGFLGDPEISLFDSSGNLVLTDNNWGDGGNASTIAAADQAVGAFALSSGSLDAAALATISPGSHTFKVYDNVGTGIALAEAYDADTSAPTFSGSRAVNFSCRSVTGPGAGVLTAGFVVEGGNAKRVLIRAIGPSLTSFGVSGLLADPVLTLFSGSTPIATTGPGWSQDPVLASVFTDVGAFSLPVGSADAAASLMLSPGAYTAQVTSQSGASGVVLIEVYEVP